MLIQKSLTIAISLCFVVQNSIAAGAIRVATFEVDASPPLGSPMAYDPTKEVTAPLSCKGIAVIPEGQQPVVLCAVDWLGIANAAHREFREKLAAAAGTSIDRVSVHSLHQHDAPRCDFSSEAVLAEFGHAEKYYDDRFCREVLVRAAGALKDSIETAREITEIGFGEASVHEVASNRRILGDDGKVKHTRYTACKDPAVRAMPAGTIDPNLKMIVLRAGDDDVATLTFYATHPQSYYRTGQANPDFPGMARDALQEQLSSPVIHFNGAGGNIGAGKYNDGNHANRQVLADKVLKGMTDAHTGLTFVPATSEQFAWTTEAVTLPPGEHLVEEKIVPILKDEQSEAPALRTAAKHLAWLRRSQSGNPVDIGCMALGPIRILFMPGELFVEYQLAAQRMSPEHFVAMAAYGEYGPGYVCTKIAYSQGGYESSERASRVSPDVEGVLMEAMKKLLQTRQP